MVQDIIEVLYGLRTGVQLWVFKQFFGHLKWLGWPQKNRKAIEIFRMNKWNQILKTEFKNNKYINTLFIFKSDFLVSGLYFQTHFLYPLPIIKTLDHL